jgi:hypothetical protein
MITALMRFGDSSATATPAITVTNQTAWNLARVSQLTPLPKTLADKTLSIDDDLGPFKHCRVYALADMLGAPDVKKLAAKKLDDCLTETWAKDLVASDFADLVRETYETTNAGDEDIRNVLVKATRGHMNELIPRKDITAVLYEIAEYSGALVVQGHGNMTNDKYKCANCACMQRMYCNNCRHTH